MFLQSNRNDEWDHQHDDELWTAFRKGDQEAFKALFVRYHDTLLSYGIKLISNREATKDGIQRLFLRLWGKREKVAHANSVKFYLLLSLRRILFRQQERNASREQRNQQYRSAHPICGENIEEKIVKTELQQQREALYRKALNKLTDRQREILFLRLHHGMMNEEIAEITGLTHQRVRNYMSEAVSKLREQTFKDECAE